MSETANRLEDMEKMINAEDAALEEARRRRRETLRICGGFGGLLGTYAAGSLAMGVVNDPVEDADGGMILDRRLYPSLGPDGDGDTPAQSSPSSTISWVPRSGRSGPRPLSTT